VWIGDDAAVFGPIEGRLLLTTDQAVAGVHADLELVGLDDLGWRAVARAISDVAAMGGRALRAVVAVAGPPTTDLDLLYRGVGACAEAHQCPVVGGDLSGAPGTTVTVSVVGHLPTGGPVLRSGAAPGDAILVTGPLGAAAAGLRLLRGERAARRASGPVDEVLIAAHRRPRALLAEGEAARLAGATAMIDVSDGLAADLGHVARTSGVGFALDHVPVAPGATAADALEGGDDYELVMTAPRADALVAAFRHVGLRAPIVIGACTADRSQATVAGTPIDGAGWEHPWQ
jgi:thiamine-monophosphate kinase